MSDQTAPIIEKETKPKGRFPHEEILAVCLGGFLILALHKRGSLIQSEWLVLMSIFIPIFYLIKRHKLIATPNEEAPTLFKRKLWPGLILLAFAILSLFSSHNQHKWYYFINWTSIKIHLAQFHTLGITQFVLLTALLTPMMIRRKTAHASILLTIFLLVQAACIYQFLRVTGGEAVYRDDHSSFMFRFWEFSKTWPQYLNYNPYWNGGRSEHFGTASGVNSMGVLLWPLLKIAEPQQVYTLALILLYLILIPWMTIGSIRLMGGNPAAGFAGGIMALGVTRYFFLWYLHYGTVAANFAVAFIIPVTACIYRVIVLDKREKWLCPLLALSVFFLTGWPPGAIVLACFGLGLIFFLPRMTTKKFVFFAVAAIIFLVLFSKSLYIILVHSTTFKNVVGVVEAPEASKHFTLTWEILGDGWHHLRAHLREGHPLLIFLGLAGALLHPTRNIRIWFGPAIILLMLIVGWGKFYFPDLQLRRMSIPLFFVALPPAALWIGHIFQTKDARLGFFRAALISILLLGGLSVAQVYRNRTPAPYATMPAEVQELTAWLKENTPEKSRILFAGATRHKYGRAHVAAFPIYTGRELMACDYYAFSPKEVEYEYPHRKYWGQEMEFFQTYNVSHIITYLELWINFFNDRPEQYERVKSFEEKGIHVYRIKDHVSNLLLKGTGTVEAKFNRIDVTLTEPIDEAVLKYNWDEGLSVEPPAKIAPYPTLGDVNLIGIKPNGTNTIRIRFKSWL